MTIKEISIKSLVKMCTTVNRLNIKSLKSYKLTCSFLSSLGFIYPDVDYLNSYMVEGIYIDAFSYMNSRIIVYATDEEIIGFRVENIPYLCKKFLSSSLKGFIALETSKYIVYERKR